MQIQDSKPFRKQVVHLPLAIQIQVTESLEAVQNAATFADIPHFKKLKGYTHNYRLQVGQYRIGLFWTGQLFIIEAVATRGDFYKNYP